MAVSVSATYIRPIAMMLSSIRTRRTEIRAMPCSRWFRFFFIPAPSSYSISVINSGLGGHGNDGSHLIFQVLMRRLYIDDHLNSLNALDGNRAGWAGGRDRGRIEIYGQGHSIAILVVGGKNIISGNVAQFRVIGGHALRSRRRLKRTSLNLRDSSSP